MGDKSKKEKKTKKSSEDGEKTVTRKVILAPIAKPLADEKLAKKVFFFSMRKDSFNPMSDYQPKLIKECLKL